MTKRFSHKMTHIGVVRGCDARTPENYSRRVRLRETRLYWVGQHCRKFSKKRAGYVLDDWPMYRLDLTSIVPISK